MRVTAMEWLNAESLQRAASDFRFLLNRGYPRKAALQLVGNRHGLTFDQRHLLHRGVFSDEDAGSRQEKKVRRKELINKRLAIDGYNVLITVEAGLSGRPLILADDGFVRDISGLSGSFRKNRKTHEALSLILQILKRYPPCHTLFLFDAPISMSGSLAGEVKVRIKEAGLLGDARAVRVPEKIMFGFAGLVATSDTAIIDRSEEVVDLAGEIIKKIPSANILRWRKRFLKI
jgi:hypothetical protein